MFLFALKVITYGMGLSEGTVFSYVYVFSSVPCRMSSSSHALAQCAASGCAMALSIVSGDGGGGVCVFLLSALLGTLPPHMQMPY